MKGSLKSLSGAAELKENVMDWWPTFFDELEKIAVTMTPEEKRRQALQFAALGMGTIPTMSALSSKIMTGKWLPAGVGLRRWLPATAATGLFWGGALPALQHAIARTNIHKAQARLQAEKELRRLAPRGVGAVIKKAPAIAAAPMPGLNKLSPKLITGAT